MVYSKVGIVFTIVGTFDENCIIRDVSISLCTVIGNQLLNNK